MLIFKLFLNKTLFHEALVLEDFFWYDVYFLDNTDYFLCKNKQLKIKIKIKQSIWKLIS